MAGNASAAKWLDDGGRPRCRTGTFWTASADIIIAVIGSGVLSLSWAIAQLGWVAGLAAMLLFAFVAYYTATLLAGCYRTGDTHKDAVRSNLGGSKVAFCGVIQYANLVGVAIGIGYTIASSISTKAVRRAGCFHKRGHGVPYQSSSYPYMILILFSGMLILLSQIRDFDQIWWLSMVAAVISFTYSCIGLSLGIARTICNGGLMGSLNGITLSTSGVTSTQKIRSSSMIEAISSFMSSACHALSEYMCIWITTMLPPACRIARRARMPRTGAFKGSGKCIGRAREAGPAGRSSHGITALARADDCSAWELPPRKCDWFRSMGSTVINTDASCVISAAVMCMEALYRRLNENCHGAISCFLKAMAVESLKDMCEDRGVWKPNVGAPTVEGVLDVIHSLKKGIPTVHDNISLRLKRYVTFKAGELSPLEATSILQKMGPIVGVLYAAGEAYLRSTVYRGHRASRANHAVVCTGYRYVDGELCIIIMDNMEPGGPFRFVLYEAFEEFHVLTVDAC